MNRTLQKLYENMLTGTPEEVVEENTNTFSKFDLNDYTEIIYEGKSGHGDEKIIINLIKDAESKGFIRYTPNKKGWMLFALKDKSIRPEQVDRGEKGFHYLRRFLQKLGYS